MNEGKMDEKIQSTIHVVKLLKFNSISIQNNKLNKRNLPVEFSYKSDT